jgi:capsular exopolysaccharide synthesis family protein
MRLPLGWLNRGARSDEDPHGDDDLVVIVDGSLDNRLVVFHEPRSYQAEQYRAFRTNLRAMNPGDAPRTIMFTSPAPDEGKSTTISNVALSLSEFSELKVCLVDMDLRAPRLHDLFGLARTPGLSDVLLDRADPRDALQKAANPNLTIMPAGRPTEKPNEVLGSEYVLDLVRYLKQDFNYILIDTPPSNVFADASHVARVMDGLVLIVSLRDTLRHQADDALETLRAAGANVLGSFVTGTSTAMNDEVSEIYEG